MLAIILKEVATTAPKERQERSLIADFGGQPFSKILPSIANLVPNAFGLEIFLRRTKSPNKICFFVKSLMCGESTSWDHFQIPMAFSTFC
ncbi:hypothetical protein AHAS_Ahas05G0164600 [Arachis hypogaea]